MIAAIASAGRRSAFPPRRLSLPDDILLEIASYLSFRDSLSISLVSKHVHNVVPPRITTVICRYQEHIVLLHAYVFRARGGADVATERASRLSSLTLADSAQNTRHPTADTGEDLDNYETLLTMFMTVAYTAKNLKYLRIDEFHICCRTKALDGTKLRNLVHMHLSDITDGLVAGGHKFYPPTLRVLHLAQFEVWELRPQITAFALFSSIEQQQLRSLSTLIIENFVPCADLSEMSNRAPQLATVRELVLIKADLRATTVLLSRTFPNLRSLCVVEYGFPHAIGTAPTPSPRLHALTMVDSTSDAIIVPWTCDRLLYICTTPADAQALELRRCDHSELVGLTLRIPHAKMRYGVWAVVLKTLPMISWLELEILQKDLSSTLEILQYDFPDDSDDFPDDSDDFPDDSDDFSYDSDDFPYDSVECHSSLEIWSAG